MACPSQSATMFVQFILFISMFVGHAHGTTQGKLKPNDNYIILWHEQTEIESRTEFITRGRMNEKRSTTMMLTDDNKMLCSKVIIDRARCLSFMVRFTSSAHGDVLFA